MSLDPKTPRDERIRTLAQHVPFPISPTPKLGGAWRPPAYFQDAQSTPRPVGSPPGSPLGSILGKRTAEDDKESTRPSPYKADLSSHPVAGLPPKYVSKTHID